jgi:hypothetical protein
VSSTRATGSWDASAQGIATSGKQQIPWDRNAVGPEIRIWEWRQQEDVKVCNVKVAELGKTKNKYWTR